MSPKSAATVGKRPTPSLDDRYVSVYRALSEPARLEMLRLIADVDEMACTVLQGTTHLAKSTISYHIKVLAEADLISVRRSGRNFFYALRHDTVADIVPGLLDAGRAPQVRPLASKTAD